MNNNLSTHALVLKNKKQLLGMITKAVEFATDGGEDELHAAMEQIEAVAYTLKNCNYEGSEA